MHLIQGFHVFIIWLLRGEGINKNLLSLQKLDTHQKSYQKIIDNEVIRDKKNLLQFYKDLFIVMICLHAFFLLLACCVKANTFIH